MPEYEIVVSVKAAVCDIQPPDVAQHLRPKEMYRSHNVVKREGKK